MFSRELFGSEPSGFCGLDNCDETELTISLGCRESIAIVFGIFRTCPILTLTSPSSTFTLNPEADRVVRPLRSPPMTVIGGVCVAPVIWRCEVVSIVDSAISDAATAVSKVASSDSRIIDHHSEFVSVGGWDK